MRNTNGSTVIGAAVAVSQHTTENAVTVTINGGTYTANGGKQLAIVDTLGSDVSDKIKGLVKANVKNVTLEDEKIVGYTVDKEVYYVSEDAYVAVYGRPTSVWDGKKYLSTYTTITKENATTFVSEFEQLSDFKLELPKVTVTSAKALASLDLLEKYFNAKKISIELKTDKTEEDKKEQEKYASYIERNDRVKIYVDVDIDLKGSKTQNWTPLGGVYQVDFLGHTVSNLYCVYPTENEIGLFKYSGVSNLVLDEAEVEGKEYVGAVTANLLNQGNKQSVPYNDVVDLKLDKIEVKNTKVSGVESVGGIVGLSWKNITNCTLEKTKVAGKDNSGKKVGGIVGFQTIGIISGCEVSGSSIVGPKEVGGIVGRAYHQGEWKSFEIKDNSISGSTVGIGVNANDVKAITKRASKFIGSESDYVGYICGGNYLKTGISEDGKTYKGKPNNQGAVCEISGNSVTNESK